MDQITAREVLFRLLRKEWRLVVKSNAPLNAQVLDQRDVVWANAVKRISPLSAPCTGSWSFYLPFGAYIGTLPDALVWVEVYPKRAPAQHYEFSHRDEVITITDTEVLCERWSEANSRFTTIAQVTDDSYWERLRSVLRFVNDWPTTAWEEVVQAMISVKPKNTSSVGSVVIS